MATVGEERVGESHKLAWSSELGGEMLTWPEKGKEATHLSDDHSSVVDQIRRAAIEFGWNSTCELRMTGM